MKKEHVLKRILQATITRIIVGIIVVVGAVVIGQNLATYILEAMAVSPLLQKLIVGIVSSFLALGSYWLLFRFYENRTITELSARRLFRNLGVGVLLGGVLQALTIWVIYLKGGFVINAVNPVSVLLAPFIMAFTSAIFEEILVRGVVFRLMEEKLGSYIALFLSAAIFGAMHLGNPNSSLLAATGLALQAGLFLAAAYMFARNLWFPIAIHFAWNFTQAGIFGATISGNAVRHSLLTTTITGDDWYTGGAFGPEGSLQATVFCLIATVVLLVLIRKQGTIILPYWKHRKA